MSTLEREVARQKAWIHQCNDPQALIDRMSEYRDDVRGAVRDKNALVQMRASDLLELAEDRLAEIKAEQLQADDVQESQVRIDYQEPDHHQGRRLPQRPMVIKAHPSQDWQHTRDANAQKRMPTSEDVRQARLAREAGERQRLQVAEDARQAQEQRLAREAEVRRTQAAEDARRERERRLAEEERLAASRLANAQAAELEARTALLKQQAEQLVRPPPQRTVVKAPVSQVKRLPVGLVPTIREAIPAGKGSEVPVAVVPPVPKTSETRPLVGADVETPAPAAPVLMQVSQLTGADLVRWRSAQGLSQRQAAERLGVAHGTVAKAEIAPEKVLGELLAVALRALLSG